MFIIQFHLYKKVGVEQTEAHFRSLSPEKGRQFWNENFASYEYKTIFLSRGPIVYEGQP